MPSFSLNIARSCPHELTPIFFLFFYVVDLNFTCNTHTHNKLERPSGLCLVLCDELRSEFSRSKSKSFQLWMRKAGKKSRGALVNTNSLEAIVGSFAGLEVYSERGHKNKLYVLKMHVNSNAATEL